jgi:hypothetical protein
MMPGGNQEPLEAKQSLEKIELAVSNPPPESSQIATPKHGIGACILQGFKWVGWFFINLLCSMGTLLATIGFSGVIGYGLGIAVAVLIGACSVVAPWITIATIIFVAIVVGGGLFYGIAKNTFSEIYPKIYPVRKIPAGNLRTGSRDREKFNAHLSFAATI